MPESSNKAALEAREISRTFGETRVLNGVSLEVEAGEFFSLLGPSGCGKTTLLRIIAGLDIPDAGSVEIAGKPMAGIESYRRDVNTVFQSYALFPHLTVYDNVAFGLKMRKAAAGVMGEKVKAAMEMVEISRLAGRFPGELSGGQKQRVALARAFINEPKLLLLDEPLAALDARLRKQLQGELKALQRRLGMTFIYVTHDQDEALSMSDRIAVMNHGRIEQLGTPREVYERPRTAFVASFIGGANILEVFSTRLEGDRIILETSIGPVVGRNREITRPIKWIAIRPEKIIMGSTLTGSAANGWKGTVGQVRYSGAAVEREARVEGKSLLIRGFNQGDWNLETGQEVALSVRVEDIIPLVE